MSNPTQSLEYLPYECRKNVGDGVGGKFSQTHKLPPVVLFIWAKRGPYGFWGNFPLHFPLSSFPSTFLRKIFKVLGRRLIIPSLKEKIPHFMGHSIHDLEIGRVP